MKKKMISAAILTFAAVVFFVSKNNSLSNILESNVAALVEVSNAEYKIKCNGSTELIVEEWVETHTYNSSKKGYVSYSQNNYCGVEGHPSCSNNMDKCKKSNHTQKCYHPTSSYPLYWPSSDPL